MNQKICNHYTCKKKTDNMKCLKMQSDRKRPSQFVTGRETADLNTFLINTSSILKKIQTQNRITVSDEKYILKKSQNAEEDLFEKSQLKLSPDFRRSRLNKVVNNISKSVIPSRKQTDRYFVYYKPAQQLELFLLKDQKQKFFNILCMNMKISFLQKLSELAICYYKSMLKTGVVRSEIHVKSSNYIYENSEKFKHYQSIKGVLIPLSKTIEEEPNYFEASDEDNFNEERRLFQNQEFARKVTNKEELGQILEETKKIEKIYQQKQVQESIHRIQEHSVLHTIEGDKQGSHYYEKQYQNSENTYQQHQISQYQENKEKEKNQIEERKWVLDRRRSKGNIEKEFLTIMALKQESQNKDQIDINQYSVNQNVQRLTSNKRYSIQETMEKSNQDLEEIIGSKVIQNEDELSETESEDFQIGVVVKVNDKNQRLHKFARQSITSFEVKTVQSDEEGKKAIQYSYEKYEKGIDSDKFNQSFTEDQVESRRDLLLDIDDVQQTIKTLNTTQLENFKRQSLRSENIEQYNDKEHDEVHLSKYQSYKNDLTLLNIERSYYKTNRENQCFVLRQNEIEGLKKISSKNIDKLMNRALNGEYQEQKSNRTIEAFNKNKKSITEEGKLTLSKFLTNQKEDYSIDDENYVNIWAIENDVSFNQMTRDKLQEMIDDSNVYNSLDDYESKKQQKISINGLETILREKINDDQEVKPFYERELGKGQNIFSKQNKEMIELIEEHYQSIKQDCIDDYSQNEEMNEYSKINLKQPFRGYSNTILEKQINFLKEKQRRTSLGMATLKLDDLFNQKGLQFSFFDQQQLQNQIQNIQQKEQRENIQKVYEQAIDKSDDNEMYRKLSTQIIQKQIQETDDIEERRLFKELLERLQKISFDKSEGSEFYKKLLHGIIYEHIQQTHIGEIEYIVQRTNYEILRKIINEENQQSNNRSQNVFLSNQNHSSVLNKDQIVYQKKPIMDQVFIELKPKINQQEYFSEGFQVSKKSENESLQDIQFQDSEKQNDNIQNEEYDSMKKPEQGYQSIIIEENIPKVQEIIQTQIPKDNVIEFYDQKIEEIPIEHEVEKRPQQEVFVYASEFIPVSNYQDMNDDQDYFIQEQVKSSKPYIYDSEIDQDKYFEFLSKSKQNNDENDQVEYKKDIPIDDDLLAKSNFQEIQIDEQPFIEQKEIQKPEKQEDKPPTIIQSTYQEIKFNNQLKPRKTKLIHQNQIFDDYERIVNSSPNSIPFKPHDLHINEDDLCETLKENITVPQSVDLNMDIYNDDYYDDPYVSILSRVNSIQRKRNETKFDQQKKEELQKDQIILPIQQIQNFQNQKDSNDELINRIMREDYTSLKQSILEDKKDALEQEQIENLVKQSLWEQDKQSFINTTSHNDIYNDILQVFENENDTQVVQKQRQNYSQFKNQKQISGVEQQEINDDEVLIKRRTTIDPISIEDQDTRRKTLIIPSTELKVDINQRKNTLQPVTIEEQHTRRKTTKPTAQKIYIEKSQNNSIPPKYQDIKQYDSSRENGSQDQEQNQNQNSTNPYENNLVDYYMHYRTSINPSFHQDEQTRRKTTLKPIEYIEDYIEENIQRRSKMEIQTALSNQQSFLISRKTSIQPISFEDSVTKRKTTITPLLLEEIQKNSKQPISLDRLRTQTQNHQNETKEQIVRRKTTLKPIQITEQNQYNNEYIVHRKTTINPQSFEDEQNRRKTTLKQETIVKNAKKNSLIIPYKEDKQKQITKILTEQDSSLLFQNKICNNNPFPQTSNQYMIDQQDKNIQSNKEKSSYPKAHQQITTESDNKREKNDSERLSQKNTQNLLNDLLKDYQKDKIMMSIKKKKRRLTDNQRKSFSIQDFLSEQKFDEDKRESQFSMNGTGKELFGQKQPVRNYKSLIQPNKTEDKEFRYSLKETQKFIRNYKVQKNKLHIPIKNKKLNLVEIEDNQRDYFLTNQTSSRQIFSNLIESKIQQGIPVEKTTIYGKVKTHRNTLTQFIRKSDVGFKELRLSKYQYKTSLNPTQEENKETLGRQLRLSFQKNQDKIFSLYDQNQTKNLQKNNINLAEPLIGLIQETIELSEEEGTITPQKPSILKTQEKRKTKEQKPEIYSVKSLSQSSNTFRNYQQSFFSTQEIDQGNPVCYDDEWREYQLKYSERLMKNINSISENKFLKPKEKEESIHEVLSNKISYTFLIYCLQLKNHEIEKISKLQRFVRRMIQKNILRKFLQGQALYNQEKKNSRLSFTKVSQCVTGGETFSPIGDWNTHHKQKPQKDLKQQLDSVQIVIKQKKIMVFLIYLNFKYNDHFSLIFYLLNKSSQRNKQKLN